MQSKPADASRDNKLESFNAIPTVPPIHRVPYELLSDIMLCVLTLRWDEWGTNNYDWIIPSQLLRLCSICRRWRQVALTSPRLWTSEDFPLLPRHRDKSVCVAINKMFLKHSAQSTISVELLYDSDSAPPPREILTELVGAAHRWQSFYMSGDRVPRTFGSDFLARMAAGGMQNLEDLHLSVQWPEMAARLDIFQDAPRLRGVTLQMDVAISQIPPIPWAQLTRLNLNYISPQLCLGILVRCKNLVDVRFGTDQWQKLPGCTANTCVLKYLERLDISITIRSAGEHLGPFLRYFELPALKSLALRLCFYRHSKLVQSIPRLAPSLTTFLTNAPRVEFLELVDCVFPEDVSEILQHTPLLTCLRFNQRYTNDINDEFFEALCHDSAAPDVVLVPKLENLDLYNVGVDFDEQSLLKMIESRWASDEELASMSAPPRFARLKLVRFSSDDEIPPKKFSEAFMGKMKQYVSEGFDVWWRAHLYP